MNRTDTKLFNVPVSMLRQYCFCPRIPFFYLLRGLQPSAPPWTKQGDHYHRREVMLEKRRKLSRFGVSQENFRIIHEVKLYNADLGFHGICDAVIFAGEQIVPLEFKIAEAKPERGAILQLTAYAMLLEAREKRPIPKAFVLYGSRGKTLEVQITTEQKSAVMNVADTIRNSCDSALLPATTASDRQCSQCEFLNFCADRL